jgi:hypothetical protein
MEAGIGARHRKQPEGGPGRYFEVDAVLNIRVDEATVTGYRKSPDDGENG